MITFSQLQQFGKKCHCCEKKATWLDKFNEDAFAYCDEHFPYREDILEFDQINNNIKFENP